MKYVKCHKFLTMHGAEGHSSDAFWELFLSIIYFYHDCEICYWMMCGNQEVKPLTEQAQQRCHLLSVFITFCRPINFQWSIICITLFFPNISSDNLLFIEVAMYCDFFINCYHVYCYLLFLLSLKWTVSVISFHSLSCSCKSILLLQIVFC